MACIAPSAQSMILGDRWSSRARNRFITLVSGHTLIVTLYSILHGVMRVHVHIPVETGDISMADLLVEEGHAQSAPENFESLVSLVAKGENYIGIGALHGTFTFLLLLM